MKRASVHRSHRPVLACAAALALSGCGLSTAPILDPKGPVALAERDLLFDAVTLMLIVIVPVFVMAFAFARRYRASNTRARYTPDWSYSVAIDAVIWLAPAAIVVALATLVWQSTHRLDPYKELAATVEPLRVEVVAQDWKWLFIYPEQNVASVNELAFEAGRPLSLRITSDTVMNSFYVPALAGQIYAMAGMQTRLNLLADEPGTFTGRNAQYSGDGFSDQHFTARALTQEGFASWVETARAAPARLDQAAYDELAMPTIGHAVTHYSGVEPGLFDAIMAKYAAGPRAHTGDMSDAR